MKVSTQKLPESQVLLEVELDQEQMDRSMDRAYRKLAQRVEIPGFRKGKTPRPMLERHIGRGRILEEAIDIAVPEAYNKALEDEDIDAIGQPSIELVTAEPLAFKATIPVRPTVDLGDYKSVRVEREPVEVDEKDVQTTLEELRRRYAVHEPVDRPVKAGDIVRADVRIEVEGNEVYKDEDVELHLHGDRPVLLPGFVEGVTGAKKGEPKEIKVTVPDDAGEAIAGKPAVIHATIKEVKEERLPEPNDEFAKEVGEGFDSIAALMNRLRDDIRVKLDANAEDAYREKVLTALVEGSAAMEFPPVLVEREIDHFIQDQVRSLGMEPEKYFELIKRSEAEVRDDLRESATERVKRSLALSRLSVDEDINVLDTEVDDEIDKLISQAAAGNEEQGERYRKIFESPEAKASLARSLLTRKTMDRLIEIASETNGVTPAKKKAPERAKAKSKKQPVEEAS